MKIKASKANFTCDTDLEAFIDAKGLDYGTFEKRVAPENATQTLRSFEHEVTACLVGDTWILFQELTPLEAKLWKKMRRGF